MLILTIKSYIRKYRWTHGIRSFLAVSTNEYKFAFKSTTKSLGDNEKREDEKT